MDETFSRLTRIIADTFGIDPASVTPETTADDVDSWDSLNHLRLITAVEQQFSVRLSMSEIMSLENVGDLASVLQRSGGQS